MTLTRVVVPCWLARLLFRHVHWARLWRGLVLRCQHGDTSRDESLLSRKRDALGRFGP